jgi:hypothetical protein
MMNLIVAPGNGIIFTDNSGLFTVTGSPGSSIATAFASQSQNYVLAGPSSGGAGAASFRALVKADIPSGIVTWDRLGSAVGSLTLANAGYASTFNQTSAVAWLWANTTVATVSTTNASPLLELAANYWATGGVTGVDLWTVGIAALTAGLNSPSTLTFTHTGSTGSAAVRVPLLDIGGTDAGISRIGAASLAIGNGTAGDISGSLTSAQFLIAPPTTVFAVAPTNGSRNDYTGALGFRFTVIQNLTVTTLGRFYSTGNSQNHQVTLWDESGPTKIAQGTVLAASVADAQGFKYVSITPVTLLASHTYRIAVDETSGGDVWHDSWTGSFNGNTLNVLGNVYVGTQGAYPSNFGGTSNVLFDAPTFQYTVAGQFSVTGSAVVAGTLTLPPIGQSNSLNLIIGPTNSGLYSNGANLGVSISSTLIGYWTTVGYTLVSGTVLGWNSFDTGISRLGAASLAIGNGTASDTSGNISAKTHTVTASSGAPTSAGTAGTVGQIIAYGGVLYFCSVTGAAGAATWNKLSMTAV